MDRSEILKTVQGIFRDILDDEEIILEDTTSADDVEGWDSLTHIQLIVATEKQFKIKFTSKEILSWRNVGEMLDSISRSISN
jgi:acyl carrier protein